MIISSQNGFFFVHIPKNGGSSVRDQIQSMDDTKGLFLGTKEHAELGIYDSSHVPLVWVQQHFSEWYDSIRALEGFCLLRDPLERFASSTAQRFRQFKGKTPSDVTQTEIHAEIDEVITHLSECDRFPISEMSHFMRQSEFVMLDGVQIVKHTYRLDDIDLLIGALSRKSGTPLVTGFHSNKSFELRHRWIKKPLTISKDLAKKYLPNPVTDRLRRTAIQLLSKQGKTEFSEVVAGSQDIRNFIETYYAEDFKLHESIPPVNRTTAA